MGAVLSLKKPVPVGSGAVISCSECGEFIIVEVTPGPIPLDFAHEHDCAFLAAVEGGTAEQWIAERGYPIHVTPAKGGA